MVAYNTTAVRSNSNCDVLGENQPYKECHIKLNDCIRNTTVVCNPRQNSVRDKIREKNFFVRKRFLTEKNSVKKKIVRKKIVLDIVLDFQCTKWAVSDNSMLIITKQYIS